ASATNHSRVLAHFASSVESLEISGGCRGTLCLTAVSRRFFRRGRLFGRPCLWRKNIFSRQAKGRGGRDRFALAETVLVGARRAFAGGRPAGARRLVRMSAFDCLSWR